MPFSQGDPLNPADGETRAMRADDLYSYEAEKLREVLLCPLSMASGKNLDNPTRFNETEF
jgi:hypothetical protein